MRQDLMVSSAMFGRWAVKSRLRGAVMKKDCVWFSGREETGRWYLRLRSINTNKDFADILYAKHAETAKSVPVRVEREQKQQLEENVKKVLDKVESP